MILRLALDLPEDESFTSLSRSLTRTLLEHLMVAQDDIDDLELVIGELSTNAVRHSGDAVYTLEIEFFADRAVVTVRDRGQGFSFADVPTPGTVRPPDTGNGGAGGGGAGGVERIGGWGLPLVEMLSDQVQFFRTDPHGTTVRAEKTLRYRNEAAVARAARAEKRVESRIARDEEGASSVP